MTSECLSMESRRGVYSTMEDISGAKEAIATVCGARTLISKSNCETNDWCV